MALGRDTIWRRAKETLVQEIVTNFTETLARSFDFCFWQGRGPTVADKKPQLWCNICIILRNIFESNLNKNGHTDEHCMK